LGQDVRWQTGSNYTLDAFGQWFKQEVYRDLNQLNRTILLWLNRFRSSLQKKKGRSFTCPSTFYPLNRLPHLRGTLLSVDWAPSDLSDSPSMKNATSKPFLRAAPSSQLEVTKPDHGIVRRMHPRVHGGCV